MELKVWVEGIQRVVCGASYSTTCQDVVIALASAMGRTGRFTLVENWRDSQRPLFPNECPLQSLRKWGEYAAEVRFCLVQAESEAKQQTEFHHKGNVQSPQLNTFINNFSPPPVSPRFIKPAEVESIKRSSTFSGVHGTDYVASSALALSLSHKAAALPQEKHNLKTFVPVSTTSARGQPSGHISLSNGEVASLSSTSSHGSSNKLFHGHSHQPSFHPEPFARQDMRDLYPKTNPDALPSYQNKNISTHYHDPSSSLLSSVMSTQHLYPPSKYSHQRQSSKPSLSPSTNHQLSSQSSMGTEHPFYSHSQKQNPTQQAYLESSHHLQQLYHPKSSSPGNLPPSYRDNLLSGHHQEAPNQRERAQGDKLLGGKDLSRHSFKSNTIKPPQVETNSLNEPSQDDVFYDDSQEVEPLPYTSRTSYGSGTHDGFRLTDKSANQPENNGDFSKAAPLDRRIQRSKVSREVATRSWGGDESIANSRVGWQVSGTDMNQRELSEGNKLTLADSGLIKNKKLSPVPKGKNVSSFLSAVAHIRSQGDAVLNVTKPESLPRQQVSGSANEDGYFKGSNQNATVYSQNTHSRKDSSTNSSTHNAHHIPTDHHIVQPNKPVSPLNTISSSRHSSAFTAVSPKSSHQGSPSPVSPAPVAYSLDTFSSSSNIIHQKQNSQTSLEIEEYDLDQNFPDVLQRDVPDIKEVPSFREIPEGNRPSRHYFEEGRMKYGRVDVDAERLQFLRIVNVQEERLKTQEAQIYEADMEIATLEDEESKDRTKLKALAAEVSQLEKQEAEFKVQLDDLERVQWMSVLDGEKKLEADINLQISSLKKKIQQMDSQIKQLNEEADQKSKVLKLEEERIVVEHKKLEEFEKKASSEIIQLKGQIADLNRIIEEREKNLKEVDSKVSEADTHLRQQEETLKAMEEELLSEDLQVSPLPTKASSDPVPETVSGYSTSDNGEAILKILEGRLSPRLSPFATGDGVDNLNGVTSAQYLYKSAMAAKNPNGVWV